jgi:heat shock protein HtpX
MQTRQTNFAAGMRTALLLGFMTGLLILIGAIIGGSSMALVFLGIAAVMNLGSYWFSDKIALAMSHAKAVSEEQLPELYQMTRELTHSAQLPMPRLYIINNPQPNAFATGRNPSNAAVAVTEGLMQSLDKEELRGVIAHELAHIKNRDILTQSVAATIAGAITYLGYMLLFLGRGNNSPIGLVGALAMMILAPLAAGMIQMAISRQREYAADATGAGFAGNSLGLSSALAKLETGAEAMPMQVNQAAEPLYIVKPFSGKGLSGLFSTHPPIKERIARLEQLRV